MGNRIWELIGERAIQNQEELEFVIATQGSPYDEVTGMEGQQIAINPYIQYGGILSGLLENDSFLQSEEGKLLFHQAVYRLLQIEKYAGCDKNYFIKRLIEKEITTGKFGEEISEFYQMLIGKEQNRTLENIMFFYQHKQSVDVFAREVSELYPHCMLFQNIEEPGHIYVYMGTAKDRHVLWMIERCRDLFLPIDTQVHIAWTEAFLMTDMHRLDVNGKCIV